MTRPLIAILRGIRPDQVIEVGDILLAAGFETIEIPLNSPQPFDSIRLLVDAFGDRATIGAGTVLAPDEVHRAFACGSRIIVSPNTDRDVIAATRGLNMQSWPGAFTPTECLAALRAGADGLKIFPAGLVGIAGIGAIRAVLPAGTRLYAVGGVEPGGFHAWLQGGIDGFGIGSALFRPGMALDDIRRNSHLVVDAYDRAVARMTDNQTIR